MFDEEELAYWVSEYPELEEEEILEILEALEMEEDMEGSTRFSDYVSDEEPEPTGLEASLGNILGNK